MRNSFKKKLSIYIIKSEDIPHYWRFSRYCCTRKHRHDTVRARSFCDFVTFHSFACNCYSLRQRRIVVSRWRGIPV